MQKIIKYILIGLIFINFLYCVSGVVHYPLASVDEVSIWMVKAKLFYLNGVFPLNQLNTLGYGHAQYPVLLPLLMFLFYRIIGGVYELPILMVYPITYLLILYVCYRTLIKLKIKKNWVLLFTYIYSMFSPLLAMGGRMHAGEADIFVVLAYWLLFYFYMKFAKERSNKWLLLVVLVVVIASNIKMEGVFMSIIFFFIPIDKTRKILFFTLSVVPLLVWIIVRTKLGVQSDLDFYIPGILETMRRFILVLYYTVKEMLKIQDWYIFWPIFALGLLFVRKSDMSPVMTNFVVLTVVFTLFVANYVFSVLSPAEYVSSSIDRVLLQLSALYFPIFAYQTYVFVAKIIK